jgi:hypothetical protein
MWITKFVDEILLCLLELLTLYLCGAGVQAVATRIGSCNSFLQQLFVEKHLHFARLLFSNMIISIRDTQNMAIK